jgi:hypothetical protein
MSDGFDGDPTKLRFLRLNGGPHNGIVLTLRTDEKLDTMLVREDKNRVHVYRCSEWRTHRAEYEYEETVDRPVDEEDDE